MAKRRDRARTKGRKNTSPFVRLDHRMLDHPDYLNLSHPAKALLTDMLRQYNGNNNGDFCVTLSVMSKRGWTSNDTLRRALNQLIAANLVMLTRQGGRHKPSLYAVTFLNIDPCNGKLECPATKVPPRNFSKIIPSPGIKPMPLGRHTA